uniref:F-box domain-containing protein n=1 Tax=Quercus lobata TaxID=97700 RepID=A0A7N2R7G8_QUELO
MLSQLRRKLDLSYEILPDDVVFDILTRLPVKSLIRFRCVSKSWYATITSRIFITRHLNFNLNLKLSSKNNHNGYLLCKSDNELCTLVYNSDRTLTEVSRFQIPLWGANMVDYCNGIFFLYSYVNPTIYLWNPSIQMFKTIDATRFRPFTMDYFDSVVFGFAYLAEISDFKILRIVSYKGFDEEKAPPAEAEVYTLSTDSWRTVEILVESVPNIRYILAVQPNSCLFFNGALHFIACTLGNDDNSFILSFDVNDEIFRDIKLPENYLDGLGPNSDHHVHQLVVFKGSLALVVIGPDDDVDEDEDEEEEEDDDDEPDTSNICLIWVMREYGVVESWTKTNVLFDWVIKLFGCTNSGEFLVQMFDRRLVSLDTENLKVNHLGIQIPFWLYYTADLMKSLVLLDQYDISQLGS